MCNESNKEPEKENDNNNQSSIKVKEIINNDTKKDEMLILSNANNEDNENNENTIESSTETELDKGIESNNDNTNLVTLKQTLVEGEFFADMEDVYQMYNANLIWKNRIVKLCETYNNFIFNFSDVFLKSTFSLKKFQKVFVFEAPNKVKERGMRLHEIGNDIVSLSKNENIATLMNNLVVRNGDMLDIDFKSNIIPLNLKQTYKDSLSTLLLITKILNRQQMQLTPLLLEAEKIDKSFLNIFYELRLLESPLLCKPNTSVDIKDFCENIFQLKKTTNDTAKIIGDSTKLKSLFISSMQRGIFTAYNEIIRSKQLFIQAINSSSTEFDSSFYTALFDELLLNIKEYLLNNFEIKPLSVNRGDQFNFELHTVNTEPVSNTELPNNTISEVVKYGFELNGNILVLSDIIIVKN